MSSGGSTNWAEDALDEPWLVERSLSELNWGERDIAEFVAEYLELRSSHASRPTIVRRIREMLGRRTIVEEEAWIETLRVPLYRFSAPRASGALVKFSEGEAFFRSGYWILKIFGVGTADSETLQVATTNTYVATNGECKLVFVPVRIRAARVRVEEQDVVVGHGIRAQVIRPKTKNMSFVRGRGCMTLPKGDCRSGPGQTPDEDIRFSLAGDRGAEPHTVTRRWESDVAHDVSVSLNAAGVNVGPVARVRRVHHMQIDMVMPAGYEYLGFRASGGLWWETP